MERLNTRPLPEYKVNGESMSKKNALLINPEIAKDETAIRKFTNQANDIQKKIDESYKELADWFGERFPESDNKRLYNHDETIFVEKSTKEKIEYNEDEIALAKEFFVLFVADAPDSEIKLFLEPLCSSKRKLPINKALEIKKAYKDHAYVSESEPLKEAMKHLSQMEQSRKKTISVRIYVKNEQVWEHISLSTNSIEICD